MNISEIKHVLVIVLIISLVGIFIVMGIGMKTNKDTLFMRILYVVFLIGTVFSIIGIGVSEAEIMDRQSHFVESNIFANKESFEILDIETMDSSLRYVVGTKGEVTVVDVDVSIKDDDSFNYEIKEEYFTKEVENK